MIPKHQSKVRYGERMLAILLAFLMMTPTLYAKPSLKPQIKKTSKRTVCFTPAEVKLSLLKIATLQQDKRALNESLQKANAQILATKNKEGAAMLRGLLLGAAAGIVVGGVTVVVVLSVR